MLGMVVPEESLRNGFFTGPNPWVAPTGSWLRVARTRPPGLDNRYSRRPGNIAEHLMKLEIHLVERLLYLLDMAGGQRHEASAVAQARADSTDILLGSVRGAQQADGV